MVQFTTKGGLDLQQELAKLANGRSAFSASLEKSTRKLGTVNLEEMKA
jgi:hypothetical protein